MDWDSDGRKDLITGDANGTIRFYRNNGTDPDPSFASYTRIFVGGSEFDCGDDSHPHVADWNNDGKRDLLCGAADGTIHLLINSGTNSTPVFLNSSLLADGGSVLDVGANAAPTVADWNRDGRKDLIAGEAAGHLHYFENIGADHDPVFNGKILLEAGGTLFTAGTDSRPDVTDWDNDGVTDILCGTGDGYILYCHSLGPLSVDNNVLSESSGGACTFTLDGGTSRAGRRYFLLATASGTQPGFVLPGGAILPLNVDALMRTIVRNHTMPPFIGFRSTLDADGVASALLSVPTVPLAAGSLLHFAYTTEVPYDFQSNPVPVEIVP